MNVGIFLQYIFTLGISDDVLFSLYIFAIFVALQCYHKIKDLEYKNPMEGCSFYLEDD